MGTDPASRNECTLGLDAGTQSLKAVLVDRDLAVCAEASVDFDEELPQFGTTGGVHVGTNGKIVTSPPQMWVAALDRLLEKMRDGRWPLNRVAAVSGSGQQHGSVWLRAGAAKVLAELEPARPLLDQVGGVFAVDESPVWMDTSTGAQCAQRESAMGGAQAVAEVTGSRAYERFTGNQIARLYQEQPDRYAATECIALVSSFMASLLAGRVAEIDVSDGSGMNLMDIRTRDWSSAALDCTAPGLRARLGDPIPSHADVGVLAPYYRERFGFPDACRVVAFSGDNPNSLAGLRLLHAGDVAVSLGTSDTLFGALDEPRPSGREGHVFVSPIVPEGFMALLCWKNGSLTREAVRDDVAGGSWEKFDALLAGSSAGNGGCIGCYFREPEITPPVAHPAVCRHDRSGRETPFTPAEEARAVIEGRFLAMRLHAATIGMRPRRVRATGGASENEQILRIMANVLGVPVEVDARPGSAALGAAYRARHGLACRCAGRFVPFDEALGDARGAARVFEPDAAAHAVYSDMLPRYAELEKHVGAAEEKGNAHANR